MPQLRIPTFFKQGGAYCYIRGYYVEVECVNGFRAHKNWGFCQVLLDCHEFPVAFLIPFGLIGSPQGVLRDFKRSVAQKVCTGSGQTGPKNEEFTSRRLG